MITKEVYKDIMSFLDEKINSGPLLKLDLNRLVAYDELQTFLEGQLIKRNQARDLEVQRWQKEQEEEKKKKEQEERIRVEKKKKDDETTNLALLACISTAFM